MDVLPSYANVVATLLKYLPHQDWPDEVKFTALPDPLSEWNGVFTKAPEIIIGVSPVYIHYKKRINATHYTLPCMICKPDEKWMLSLITPIESILCKSGHDQSSPIGVWQHGALVFEKTKQKDWPEIVARFTLKQNLYNILKGGK
jgi:hypothetical protein